MPRPKKQPKATVSDVSVSHCHIGMKVEPDPSHADAVMRIAEALNNTAKANSEIAIALGKLSMNASRSLTINSTGPAFSIG